MEHYLNEFFFGIYPYIAMAVFLVGSILRFRYSQYGWKSGSSQLMSSKGMLVGNNLFHVGIILLFFGHFIGLLTPETIYTHFITVPQKQIL